MPVAYTGSITFLRNGKRERIVLTYVPSFPALQKFAEAIYPFSTAGICAISFTASTDPELSEQSGEISTVSFQLRVKLRQATPPAGHDPAMKMLNIPAPDSSNFDNIPSVGYRLKQDKGEQIAAEYSELTGETWNFEDGWICG